MLILVRGALGVKSEIHPGCDASPAIYKVFSIAITSQLQGLGFVPQLRVPSGWVSPPLYRFRFLNIPPNQNMPFDKLIYYKVASDANVCKWSEMHWHAWCPWDGFWTHHETDQHPFLLKGY